MDRIQLDITRYAKQKGPQSERADLVGQFTDKLNNERKGTKYKQLRPSFVAIKLSHIPTQDLYYFLKVCSQSGSFGRAFFGLLKTSGATENTIHAPTSHEEPGCMRPGVSPHGEVSDIKRD